MANQTVKIVGFSNGISKVEAVSGAQRGTDLFVDGELGTKGDRVEVPEFRVEDSDSDSAKTYYAEVFHPSKVIIFEEADGFHWNYDNNTGTRDARGKGYPTKKAAMDAARENFEQTQSL